MQQDHEIKVPISYMLTLQRLSRLIPIHLLAIVGHLVAAPPQQPAFRIEDLQMGEFGSRLCAIVDGRQVTILDRPVEAFGCITVERTGDFDGDGNLDALIRHSGTCGGNLLGEDFLLVLNHGEGAFTVTETFGEGTFNELLSVEPWGEALSVVIASNNEGINTDTPLDLITRYVVRNGRLMQVDRDRVRERKALKNVRSRALGEPDEIRPRTIQLDLQGIGRKTMVRCEPWGRWGRMFVTLQFPNGHYFKFPDALKRLGLLPTSTHGYKDLVVDLDDVYRWDGITYRMIPHPDARFRLKRRPSATGRQGRRDSPPTGRVPR
jgi:hypothetical protein